MTLRFLKDYRSRAFMCRYGAGTVVDVDRPEVIRACLEGGFAVVVRHDATEVTVEPEAERAVIERPEQPKRRRDGHR